MRILVVVFAFAFVACGGSTSESQGDDAGDDGATSNGDETGSETQTSAGATSCAGDVREGGACVGTFTCDQGTISCCIGGEIVTRPLYFCDCRDGKFVCSGTDDCWGIPHTCPSDAGAD